MERNKKLSSHKTFFKNRKAQLQPPTTTRNEGIFHPSSDHHSKRVQLSIRSCFTIYSLLLVLPILVEFTSLSHSSFLHDLFHYTVNVLTAWGKIS